LYRVNWGRVGFNIIDGTGPFSVGVDNTLNSWIYGNVSCYNGMGIYYDGEGGFTEYRNTFVNPSRCSRDLGPIIYGADHCLPQIPISFACFGTDNAARGAGY
jgi:hypothetical protein